MIRNSNFFLFTVALTLAAALFVVSCRSAKDTSKTGEKHHNEYTSKTPELRALISKLPNQQHISARLKLTATLNGKSNTLGGTIKIKKGEGIQISITALGLMEVARLDFSPDSLILLYRIGKEYSVIPYDKISLLSEIGINYTHLQSILLNEIFLPDGKSIEGSLSSFFIKQSGDQIILEASKHKNLRYSFFVDKKNEELVRTKAEFKNRIHVECEYSKFTKLNTANFPQNIRFSTEGTDKKIEINFALSNIKNSEFPLQPTKPSSSYKRVEAEELLNIVQKSL